MSYDSCATEPLYHFTERDVWTFFHSCAFDFSVWELWGALLYGGRVVVVPDPISRSPKEFYKLLVDEGVTVLNQTPSAFKLLMEAESGSGTDSRLALRYVIFGGEALEMSSLKPWFDRHGDQQPRLINMYGITDTTVHVTYRRISSADVTSGSVMERPSQICRFIFRCSAAAGSNWCCWRDLCWRCGSVAGISESQGAYRREVFTGFFHAQTWGVPLPIWGFGPLSSYSRH